MKYRVLVLALAIGLIPMAGAFAQSPAAPAASTTTPAATPQQLWSAWGGTVEVRWNRDLAGDVGMHISSAREALPGLSMRERDRFELRRAGSLAFHVEHGYFRGFDGGSLQAKGGYTVQLADGSAIDLSNFRLRPSASDALILDLVGSDGKAWFYIDRLMYELVDNDRTLAVGAMDMRISAELAGRIGHPEVAGWAIADLGMTTDVQTQGSGAAPLASNPHWPGTAAPNGGTWQADLFMKSFNMQYSRCQGCSGATGSGKVVFTPSSTLKNNVNAGTLAVTIPGQGDLGSSTALWAASIPWNQKFTGNVAPYGNDQHPYLIWNLYRTDAEGRIEQIGRSGVKHAWLTTNGACLDLNDHDGHVLGRGCDDTYGTNNNDDSSDLGPRSEIVPASGIWGRCGSIYDPTCVGSMTANPNGDYDQRLVVREQQISPTLNPGATYLFESWYIARDDINPYNSMATINGSPNWSGSVWSPGGGNYKLGPAIDRWVDPANPGPNARSSELAVAEGHAKLAVKVVDLGAGQWRYDYAVMNVDFARAVVSGTNPNIRVESNRGFSRFSVAIPAGAVVGATRFSDGDVDAGNDWTSATSASEVSWSAPSGSNTLDWGTLFSFSLTVDKAPLSGVGQLGVADGGAPASFALPTLAPSDAPPPVAPVASVTPSALSFSVAAGASDTQSVVVGNNGSKGSTLTFAVAQAATVCSTPAEVSWLSATPTSGSVAVGATSTIAVAVNSAGLEAGDYSARLCLTSNDPNRPLIEVPVTLGVNPPTSFTVGGTVSGLLGSGLKLRLNGGSNVPIGANGPFTFATMLSTGDTYTVSVTGQPTDPEQTCAVKNGSGTIASATVTNVEVTCSSEPEVDEDRIYIDGFDG